MPTSDETAREAGFNAYLNGELRVPGWLAFCARHDIRSNDEYRSMLIAEFAAGYKAAQEMDAQTRP